MATFYSYDDVYKIYAYRENHIRIVATQGEGATQPNSLAATDSIKSPRFQLRDERGFVTIPSSGNPRVQLAVIRPNNTEDLLDCVIEDREKSIVSCPIRKSLTDIAGDVKGEIRLITTNAVTKFYGINFFIYDGVSDSAAAQSTQFSELIVALQQVNAIVEGGSEGTISLDTVIQHNGTKPVASGILYDYLVGNYVSYKNVSNDEVDSANDNHTIYIHSVGGYRGLVFFTGYNNYTGAATVKQFRLCRDGRFEYRTGTVVTPYTVPNTYTWDKTYDENWLPIGSRANIQDGAINTDKIDDGAVTLDKINSNAKETTPTPNSTKLITSGGVYQSLQEYYTSQYINQNFRKYQTITASEIDTATDQQTLYSVYYEGVYCILYSVSGTANRIQYLHKSTGEVLYRYQRKSNDVWGDWDEWKYIASQNYSRRTSRPTASTSGKLWDIRWYNDSTGEHCYQLTSVGGTTESPIYNWTEIISKAVLDAKIDTLITTINNKIVVFSYTLSRSSWSNNQQSVSVPAGYVVTGDVMADTEIGDTAYNQLCADGCNGIYIASTTSGSTLTLTAHALGNTPTADVTIQVTLTAVTDMSQ